MDTRKTKSQILKKRAKSENKGYLPKVARFFIMLFLFTIILAGSVLLSGYYYFKKDLPKIISLKDYRPPVITTVYSDDGRKIAEFFKERRIVIPLEDMPEMLIKAFVSAEDARFYVHEGIDFLGVMRAFIKNIEAGTIVQGGSTITQQVTKSFLLTPEKSYSRKIKEAILSYRIDKTFKKNEILFLYLNQIYLGHGAYGVEAAAENYFGKSVKDMNLAECAMLAGLPQAPSKYSPFRHPERAKKRQIYVLNRMVSEGYITNSEATEAINTELDIKSRRNFYIEKVPYYTEHVRRYIKRKYGEYALYRDGLKINTAVDIDMQHVAREEIEKGTRELDKRQGYRGPLEHLAPEEIEPFCEILQAEMENSFPEDGNISKAVVINV
ncbi:MAG: transglycosylase domain-containing protein, partial [Deltaproteobacteria bacterium]|nr:transglycosylase domain-containing protein [Deltaproteobacteria bacterium]